MTFLRTVGAFAFLEEILGVALLAVFRAGALSAKTNAISALLGLWDDVMAIITFVARIF